MKTLFKKFISMPTGVLTNVKLLEDNVIPLRFRVDNLTILVAFVICATIFAIYGFYALQGRWAGYLPTITEVAVSSPNCMIYSAVFSVLGFLMFLLMTILTTWGEVYGMFSKSFVVFGYVFSLLSGILLIVAVNISLYDTLNADYVGLLPYCIVTFIFFLCLLIKLFRHMTKKLKITRLVFMIIGLLGLILSFIPFPLNFEDNCTKKAIFQLIFVVGVTAFFVSFRVEIGQLKIDLLIHAEDY